MAKKTVASYEWACDLCGARETSLPLPKSWELVTLVDHGGVDKHRFVDLCGTCLQCLGTWFEEEIL